MGKYDAIIVGSGPNGLAAAITLARAELSVLVIEARATVGGGMRSAELTLPGFTHDVCSTIHALASSSPFFQSLPLDSFGLEWVHPDLPLAHPLDGGGAAVLSRSVGETAAMLGRDAGAYERLVGPLARAGEELFDDLLGPLPLPPRHPWTLARFGLKAVQSAAGLARRHFETEEARALFAGNAAHAWLPLENSFTAAVGLMLHVSSHHAGWPVARGGSQKIADAMAAYLRSLGGEIQTGWHVRTLAELPTARAILFDTSPQAMAMIAGARLPEAYRRRLGRYRFGPAAFKVDLALDGPIPWENRACRRAGCLHLGGTLGEIARAESEIWRGKLPERPFVLVAQAAVCDATRAPVGKHTAWAYAHVPHGCREDASGRLFDQIERFAPGFRDTIIGTHTMGPAEIEAHNPNCLGGDIIGGVQDLAQMFTRPVARWNPYTTPSPDIFLCSASTPPGAGVHGMAGYFAARTALKRAFG